MVGVLVLEVRAEGPDLVLRLGVVGLGARILDELIDPLIDIVVLERGVVVHLSARAIRGEVR